MDVRFASILALTIAAAPLPAAELTVEARETITLDERGGPAAYVAFGADVPLAFRVTGPTSVRLIVRAAQAGSAVTGTLTLTRDGSEATPLPLALGAPPADALLHELRVPTGTHTYELALQGAPVAALGVRLSEASPERPISIAVMDVAVDERALDKAVAQAIASVLAAEIKARGGERYRVMSNTELRGLIMQQATVQALGCDTPACASDLGALAQAELIVLSTIAALGEGLVFSLQLVDVPTGQVVGRQNVTWRGEPSGLVELCRPTIARLIDGTAAEAYRGALEVVASEEGATVYVNDAEVGVTPVAVLRDLGIGKHSLRLAKDGYLPFATDIVVNRNESTFVQAQLIDEATLTPWYKTWWVWTAGGVVLAGALTGIVLAVTRDSAEPTTLMIEGALP